MEIKFIAQENEIQKIYNDLGLIVPVGDLSTTKAPAIQPLPTSSTQTTVTAKFNVMSGGDITALSYKVNDGDAVSLTPAKGVVTITLEDLEYNSGPYEIEITATNATGSTTTSSTIALQHYTNWATPDEVLAGNRYIGEDSEAHVGEIVTKTGDNVTVSGGNVTIPAGYYGEQVTKTYPVPSGMNTYISNGVYNVSDLAFAKINVQPNLETASITPTTSAQTITPSTGYDGIGTANVEAVTSDIDANIQADNIKKDVEILGVTGTFEGGPTDGGAIATGKEYTVSDMGMEFQALDIMFSTLPTGFDTANHTYYMFVAAPYFAEGSDPENRSLMRPLIDGNSYDISTQYNYDSTTQTYTIDFYDLDFTHYGPSIATIVYIFEDDLLHLKWIVPCTFVEQTV